MAHPDMLSTGVLRGGKAQVGCKLIGRLETSDVLEFNEDFYGGQSPDARDGLEQLYPFGIFLFSAKINDLVGEPLFFCAQVVKKVNQGLKRSV